MKSKLMKVMNGIAALLLVILGLSSCDTNHDAGEVGTPSAVYKVKGTITDQDGKPINGIKVVVSVPDIEDDNSLTSTTDEDGNYSCKQFTSYSSVSSMKLKLTDVDGQTNGGEFNNDSIMPAELKYKYIPKSSSVDKIIVEVTADKTLTKKK